MTAEPGRTGRRGRPRAAGTAICPRCGEAASRLKYPYPEGKVCGRCHDRAVHTRGACPACGAGRLLPGIDAAGRPVCADCAGIRTSFRCGSCGEEGALVRRATCEPCANRDDLDGLLGLRPGGPPGPLRLLRDELLKAPRPASVYQWLRRPRPRQLLRQLGDGALSPDHDALDRAQPQDHALAHLRALLVASGALPPRDEPLARFQAWAAAKLAAVADPASREALERFARWHHLRRLRAAAGRADSQRGAHSAKQEITAAVDFLERLHGRGTALAHCSQADIDEWLAEGPTTRHTLRGFIRFTSRSRITEPLEVPHRSARGTRRMTPQERLDAIRRFLDDATAASAADRLAALLLLVYGQPVARIAELKADAFAEAGDGTLLFTASQHPVPVPEPLAALARRHLADRTRTGTLNADHSPFLFPGGRAAGHITQSYLRTLLARHGIDVLAAKNTALDEAVASMPMPVAADALGYSYIALGQHERHRGSRYERYAAIRAISPHQPNPPEYYSNEN